MITSQLKNSPNGQSAEQLAPNSQTQIQNLKSEIQNEMSSAELAEIWARRAHNLAEEPPAEATGQTADLLVFWLGGERYGIEVTNVREIYPLEQVTPVPRTPGFITGVFSARGRILSIVDLRAFFGLPTPPSVNGGGTGEVAQTKIIAVANTNLTSETAQMEVGILADAVDDVITIFKEDLEPPLTTHGGVHAEYLQGITADMLVVVDLNTLLNDRRLIVQEEVR